MSKSDFLERIAKDEEAIFKSIRWAANHDNENGSDVELFPPTSTDIPYGLAFACTYVPEHLQDEFHQAVIAMALTISRAIVERDFDNVDIKAESAVCDLMPETAKAISQARNAAVDIH